MDAFQEFWNIDPGYTVDVAHTNSSLQSLSGFYFAAYTHRQNHNNIESSLVTVYY